MIAPYLPHITEEIYQNYFKQKLSLNEGTACPPDKGDKGGLTEISIHKFAFPENILNIANSEEIISEFEKISEIIESVRRFKTEKQISM
jgi:valyl-tRNA synthetase